MSAFLRLGAGLMRRVPGSMALGLSRDWRDLSRLPACDAALVSFPKSGRTFVRAMVARLYQRCYGLDEKNLLEFRTLARAPKGVPRLLFTHDGDAMRRPAQIWINRAAYQDCRLALLARHPGDVVVSRYHHLKHRSRDAARRRLAEQPLEDFVWTGQGGVPSIVTFLNAWAQFAADRPDIVILHYEAFLDQPQAMLQRLADLIGPQADTAIIREAVEFARFDNLKQKEREGYYASERLRPARAGDEDSFKVRSGKAGGYRVELSSAGAARIDAYLAEHLDPVFAYARQG